MTPPFFIIRGDRVADYRPRQHLYLVEPVLPMGGIALLHGAPANGKTQLATTLALDIVNGLPFMGDLATRQGRVAYIQADMPEATLHERLMRIDGELPGRLTGVDVFGFDSNFDILDDGVRAALAEEVQAIQPSLVIVDTLRKSHRLDENLSSTPTIVYSAWREVAGSGPALLYLHHNRKPNPQFPDSVDSAIRGSSAWLADADLGIHIKKIGPKGPFKVEWSKNRTFDPDAVGKDFTLRMDPKTLLLQPISDIDTWFRDAKRRGVAKEHIAAVLQSPARFGQHAVSKATAYRWLADYEPPQKEAA